MYRSDDEEIRGLFQRLRAEYRQESERGIASVGVVSAKRSAYERASLLTTLLGLLLVLSAHEWVSQLPLDHARSGKLLLVGLGLYAALFFLWVSLFTVSEALSVWRLRFRLWCHLRPTSDVRRDLARLQREPLELLGSLRSSPLNERCISLLALVVMILHVLFGFAPFCPELAHHEGLSGSLEQAFTFAALATLLIASAEKYLSLWWVAFFAADAFMIGYLIAECVPLRTSEMRVLYILNAALFIGVLLLLAWASRAARESLRLPNELDSNT